MTVLLYYAAIFVLLSAATFVIVRPDHAMAELLQSSGERKRKMQPFRKQGKLITYAGKLKNKRHSLLESSSIPRPMLTLFTVVCSIAGFLAGKIIYNSLLVSVCVAAFGSFVPILFLSLRQNKAITARLERLASSMMIVSNSYLMTDDLITTVEQNLSLLDYPEPFRDFLVYVTRMDSNVLTGLRRMEEQVNNPYFSQWVDALVLAQSDRSLKYVTVAVVDSFHDVIRAQEDSDAAMFAVWRDYLLTLILIFAVPLVFKIMMNEAYITMTRSFVGQGLFLLLMVAVAYSVVRAVHINRPIIS